MTLRVAHHDGVVGGDRRLLAHQVRDHHGGLTRQRAQHVVAHAQRRDHGARRLADRVRGIHAEVDAEARTEEARRHVHAQARAVRGQARGARHGARAREREGALAQRGAHRGVELVDGRQDRAVVREHASVRDPRQVEGRVAQGATANGERLRVGPERDGARHHLHLELGHACLSRALPRRHHHGGRHATKALFAEPVGACLPRQARGEPAVDAPVATRRHVSRRALQVHHHHLVVELLLQHALEAAGRIRRGQVVVLIVQRAVHAEDGQHRDGAVVHAVHADEHQGVVLARAAHQLVVLGPSVPRERVARVEVAIHVDAQLRRPPVFERRARRLLERVQESRVHRIAERSVADLEPRVAALLTPRRVRVRRGQQHLAREVVAQPLLEVEQQPLEHEAHVHLEDEHRLVAGGERQGLDPRRRSDAHRRDELAREGHHAVVHLAAEEARSGVGPQRGADGRVDDVLRRPGRQRAGLNDTAGPGGPHHRSKRTGIECHGVRVGRLGLSG